MKKRPHLQSSALPPFLTDCSLKIVVVDLVNHVASRDLHATPYPTSTMYVLQ